MKLRTREVDFTDVYRIIEEKIIPTLKNQYYEDKRVASGNLVNSLDGWEMDFNSDVYTMYLNLPSYWEQVENGRNKTTMWTGKVWDDSYKDISNWLVNKGIPTPSDRTLSQFVWSIITNIHKRGYSYYIERRFGDRGSHSLEKGLEKCEVYFLMIEDIISDQLGREIDLEIETL